MIDLSGPGRQALNLKNRKNICKLIDNSELEGQIGNFGVFSGNFRNVALRYRHITLLYVFLIH